MTDFDFNKIVEDDKKKKREKKQRHREALTLREYVELVRKDPKIAQNAQARALEIICGVEGESVVMIPEHERWFGIDKRYPFFAKELYGVDRAIARVVEHIEAGANRASTGKQLLLLVGPPGTGKSSFVKLLKRGFENYNARPVYVIDGCPKWEEPLHALPHYLREEFEKELGIRIEGDLCPVCRARIDPENPDAEFYDKETGEIAWEKVPVKRMTFSIQGVRGLSKSQPSGEKSADIGVLTGRENISVTSIYGYERPDSFQISGKIPKAERGVFEPQETTSNDPDVLSIFFSICEERELEIPDSSFPHLSVDTVIIGHTNLTPFKTFASKKEFEGLHQRFSIVLFPYPLRIKDELAVYKKLIERESDFVRLKKCHIAPGSLELAATFAILTRLIPQENVGLLTKAKIYNGETLLTELENAEKRPQNIAELIEAGQKSPDIARREGMFGVSSRDTLAALNAEIVRQSSRGKCLTPRLVIRALRDMFKESQRMGYLPETIETFMNLLKAGEKDSVMTEFKDYVVKTVHKAFLKAYRNLAVELFDRYVKETEYWWNISGRKLLRDGVPALERDLVTDKPREPDIKFLRSVEKHLSISDEQAQVWRGELLIDRNRGLSFDTSPTLARAIEKKLLEDSKGTLALVLATDKPLGTEEKKRVQDLFSTMKSEHGFCEVCAREAVDQAREFLRE